MNGVVIPDYSAELSEIIENQQAEIELLQHQEQVLLEQVNGLQLVVGYQFATFGVLILSLVVVILHNVLNKWFFGGV